ncbi:MAG: sigma 54-interacting transcriptional regulator [Candidatus Rokubacteria bacterium]|nr:sigma 54-interacting transcriptional regulator [Candidatus Rokubacteria bacterium]
MRTAAPAALIGLAATVVAYGAWSVGGANLTALEWAAYDGWMRDHAAVSASRDVVLVVRDPGSEMQLGSGAWDRAVLARVVAAVSRAGATAIGLDLPLEQRSSPERGGAASDVMLSQASTIAGNVVFPIALQPAGGGGPAALIETVATAEPLPALLDAAGAVGHVLAVADADGVVRRVPLLVRRGDRTVPAFALALAAVALDAGPGGITLGPGRIVLRARSAPARSIAIPVDRSARMLVHYTAARPGPTTVAFSELLTAVQDAQTERLQELVDNRIVVLLAEPRVAAHRTPDDRLLTELVLQAQVLDAVLGERWLSEPSRAGTVLGTLAAGGVAAWLVLALRRWKGAAAVALMALAYGGAVVAAPSAAGLVLPVWLPLSALVVAGGAGLLWVHLVSAYHIRQLEDEITRVQDELATTRDALVREESEVESLEDDLQAARAAAARSADSERERLRTADALHAELAAARAHEEETRRRLGELETALRGLRAADSRPRGMTDGDQDRLRRECEQVGIVTRDPGMLEVFRDLKKAARSSLPILVVGEPGTGKELVARAAHRLSPRADQPFVPVNMAAISTALFESELFGHVRGSFTGSVSDRRGFFELADGGTIFLDEIGELRPEHQSKLLRAIQEKSFYRVGATRPTSVNVRIIAASNRDLERGVAEGWFREDLYFRLKGVVLRLPPLRERPGDLELLADRLVEEAATEAERPGLRLAQAALDALRAHDWKGNVRELQQCVRQAVALAEGPVITAADLRLSAPSRAAVPAGVATDVDPGSDAAVLAALREHRFDMQATAAALGCDRSTVTQRLKGLGFRALVESAGDRAQAARALAGDPAVARVVEVKLREYHEHLLKTIRGFDSPEIAIAACRRRFKNLPERHFRSLEVLVRDHFQKA